MVPEVPGERELLNTLRRCEVGLEPFGLAYAHYAITTCVNGQDRRRQLYPYVYEGERSGLLHIPDPTK